LTSNLHLVLWPLPSRGCLLTKSFLCICYLFHACCIPTHLTHDLIILIKWIKNCEILIMHLSKHCSNNMHFIMISKVLIQSTIFQHYTQWWPPTCWLPLRHVGICFDFIITF
jgi:hypothetical protein